MADATFDGPNLLIELPAGQLEIQVQRESYSAWKEWFKTSDNSKFQEALRTVAGDPISGTQDISPAFFLRNDLGWRIRAADENIEITLVGNFYKEDDAIDMVTLRAGRTAAFYFERSQNALDLNTGSGRVF